MGNLFTSILNAANSISVYDRQLATIQNNIANASTPGYVRQIQMVEPSRFDLEFGFSGGILAGPIINTRSQYSEQSVRSQVSRQSVSDQIAGDLGRIEPLFDLSANSGIDGSLTDFFKSFSQLSINASSTTARENVIVRARSVADAFHYTASSLAEAGNAADRQIGDLVAAVNRLAEQLKDINATYQQSFQAAADAGLDARLHDTLEQLSELVDISLVEQTDGSLAVYVSGQTPLVVGNHSFPLSADFSSPQTAIRDSSGDDISKQIRFGKINALLQEKNTLLPSYMADLDMLAGSFADQVNAQLKAGLDADGATPSVDLFKYDAGLGAGMSLAVTDIAPQQIAAAEAGAPGGNGNALTIASMLTAQTVNGASFVEAYGRLSGRIGTDLKTAREDAQTRGALTAQARAFREQISGISIDEEAVHLIAVQRAYQASARLLSVLNDLSETLIGIIR